MLSCAVGCIGVVVRVSLVARVSIFKRLVAQSRRRAYVTVARALLTASVDIDFVQAQAPHVLPAAARLTGGAAVTMDPSVLANMDKDALRKQIENMKYQASMERWPLSKSIAA